MVWADLVLAKADLLTSSKATCMLLYFSLGAREDNFNPRVLQILSRLEHQVQTVQHNQEFIMRMLKVPSNHPSMDDLDSILSTLNAEPLPLSSSEGTPLPLSSPAISETSLFAMSSPAISESSRCSFSFPVAAESQRTLDSTLFSSTPQFQSPQPSLLQEEVKPILEPTAQPSIVGPPQSQMAVSSKAQDSASELIPLLLQAHTPPRPLSHYVPSSPVVSPVTSPPVFRMPSPPLTSPRFQTPPCSMSGARKYVSPSKYRSPGEVLKTYQHYCNQKDIGKVAIALAKLTYFGRQEMSECTITGHNRSTKQLRLRDIICSLIFMKHITVLFSVQELATATQYKRHITVLWVPSSQYSIYSCVQLTRAGGSDKVRDFWRQMLSSVRIISTSSQRVRIIFNLLEGGSKRLRRCMPGEASDRNFYPKFGWFSTNQATRPSHISQTVSRLGENFSSRPAQVFVEFQYSLIYGKMFFQQEITDAKVSTLFVCGM